MEQRDDQRNGGDDECREVGRKLLAAVAQQERVHALLVIRHVVRAANFKPLLYQCLADKRSDDALGVLLDLRIRKETNGVKSLRDVFHYLYQNYGTPGRCFGDTLAIEQAVEAVTGRQEREFFTKYVSGHDDLPFNEYLAFVGLRMDSKIVHDANDVTTQQRKQRAAWLHLPR